MMIGNSQTHVRFMRESDLPVVTEIRLHSFSSQNRTVQLGKDFAKAKIRWFLTRFPNLSLVCEQHNEVVGFVVGADPSYGFQLFWDIWPQVVKALITHPWLILRPGVISDAGVYIKSLRRKLPIRRTSASTSSDLIKSQSVSQKRITLAEIAVQPSCRKQGVGGKLLRAFEQQASSSGADFLRLTTKKNNVAARKAYERAGWTIYLARDGKAYYKKIIVPSNV